jgi:hypothetical protein
LTFGALIIVLATTKTAAALKIQTTVISLLTYDTTFSLIIHMNRTNRKTLAAIFSEPVPRNLEWRKIEALFLAAGKELIEGRDSRVGFKKTIYALTSTARTRQRSQTLPGKSSA